jgi:hypothetical protein
MSFKVVKLTIGKGKTVGDEKAGRWERQYYELEATIETEKDLELAKNSLEGLLDIWLKGETISGETPDTPGKSSQRPEDWGLPRNWDKNKIPWIETEGPKGKYQVASDPDNPDFKALVQDLEQHNGRLTRDNLFYWLFNNHKTVGRKPKQKS